MRMAFDAVRRASARRSSDASRRRSPAASRWTTASPSRACRSGWRSWSRAKTTASPTCSGAGAAASSGPSSSPSSPTTPSTPSRSPRSACPSTTSRSSPAPGRRPRRGSSSCSRGIDLLVLARYMQILSRRVPRAARRAGDQHPPQLPARLRRRRPLPPRPRARGQADRRHRPLRHRGARRRPDHRPGRDQGQPPRRGRRPGADRPRHRAPRPRPRGQGPHRRPRPPRRRPHRRLLQSAVLFFCPPADSPFRLAQRWSRRRWRAVRVLLPLVQASRGRGSRSGRRPDRPPAAPGAPLRTRSARLPDRAAAPLRRHLHASPSPSSAGSSTSPTRRWSRQIFTGSPEQFHAGEANATVLEPALGPNSVLTLDEAPHMQQRKLLLPPFHGERVRALRRADPRDDPQADGDLARRRALRPAPPHPADHPGGDHARRLRRPRRGAAGPLREADRGLQQAGQPGHRLPRPAPQLRPLEPLAAIPALPRGARRVRLRGDRAAPQGGRGGRGGPRRRPLAAARRPATTTAAR